MMMMMIIMIIITTTINILLLVVVVVCAVRVQVEDIESKLDLLIDMYKEDRKILLQHLQDQQQGEQGPAMGAPPQVPLKPRPILVDKQFTSEPATPTGPGLNPNRPMHRNLSDLSQRIKKRVTYRCLSLHDPPRRTPSRPPSEHETEGENQHHHQQHHHHHHHHHQHGHSPPPSDAHSVSEAAEAASQGNPDHPNPPPADPDSLRLASPLSAPPLLGVKTFGGVYDTSYGRGVAAEATDPEYSPPESSVEAALAGDRASCSTTSSSESSSLLLGSYDVFAQSSSLPVTSPSCLAGSVLSTLNEQKSMESDCSLPFMDGSTSSSSDNSLGCKKPDSCNGSPAMSTPTALAAEDESDSGGGGVGGGGGGSSSGSRTDLTAVPALESLTDFHVGCDVSKLNTTC